MKEKRGGNKINKIGSLQFTECGLCVMTRDPCKYIMLQLLDRKEKKKDHFEPCRERVLKKGNAAQGWQGLRRKPTSQLVITSKILGCKQSN